MVQAVAAMVEWRRWWLAAAWADEERRSCSRVEYTARMVMVVCWGEVRTRSRREFDIAPRQLSPTSVSQLPALYSHERRSFARRCHQVGQ